MIKATKTKSGKYTTLVPYYTADGKRHFKRFTEDSEKAVIRHALRYQEEMNRVNSPTTMLLSEAVEQYISKKQKELSPSTIRGYRVIQKNYLLELQNHSVSNITKQMFQNAIHEEIKKGLSPKSIINIHGLFYSAMNKICGIKLNDIKLPKKQKQKKILIKNNLIQQISNAVKGTVCEIPVLLALTCGLRASEILGLKWSDYDGETIIIQRAKVNGANGYIVKETNKTDAGNRILVVPKCVKKLLDSIEHDSDFIIKNHYSTIYDSYSKALKNHNIPHMPFHFLRHINAAIMKSLNIQDTYAMERGGWASDYIYKNTYAQIVSDEMSRIHSVVNDKFDEIIGIESN